MLTGLQQMSPTRARGAGPNPTGRSGSDRCRPCDESVNERPCGMRWVMLGLCVFIDGCIASVPSVAQEMFVKDYECPSADVTVVLPDSRVEVVGCGHDHQYTCAAGYATRHESFATTCSYRSRYSYEATDGSHHEAWADEAGGAVRETAILSAIHDLPCTRESIHLVDGLTLDGCGQRVTYREIVEDQSMPPAQKQITSIHRYLLIGRVAIPSSPDATK
jgi:hypothetical protein